MGRGDTQPSTADPTCRQCGRPHHIENEGDVEEVEVFDKEGRRSTAYRSIEERCEHKDSHEPRGVPLKREFPSGYPTIYDAPPSDEPE
jgi:hypothetical protein